MQHKPLVWVIAGPTASGKTALAVRLAHRLNCEIVNMDSMQIYRGMDIGTAKPSAEEQQGIPHHLLSYVPPGQPYSVAQYAEDAERVISGILQRGRQPLLTGGTGLYLRALRTPMPMGQTAANAAFRQKLEKQAQDAAGRQALWERLRHMDPETAERLHPNDARRVIRALEVTEITGRPFSMQGAHSGESPFEWRLAVLSPDRSCLYERIDRRVDEMLAAGLAEEIRRLLASGVPESAQAMKAIGYKEMLPCLRGECTQEEAADEIRKASRHYAKRQLTWFRREQGAVWFDPEREDTYDRLVRFFTEGESDEFRSDKTADQ